MKLREHWRRRAYLRGTTRLGIFNTIIGILFNRVMVLKVNMAHRAVVGIRFDKATDWPPDEVKDV